MVTKLLCMEYTSLGLTEGKCQAWVNVIEDVCINTCGKCEAENGMAESVFDSCRFDLGVILGNE